MTIIALYFLLAFLCSINQASDDNHKYHHTTTISNTPAHIRLQILNFLTLRQALALRMTSKLLENIPEIAKEDVKYLKPFLNYGFDKNIGFILSRYCSTLKNDSEELSDINKNILQLSRLKLNFNSYAFVLGLNDDLVLFGGIDKYEDKIPIKFMKGELSRMGMNKRAIVAGVKTNHQLKLFTVCDPDFYTNDVPAKIQKDFSVERVNDCLLKCTANICSVYDYYSAKVYSWGDFHDENEIPPPHEILENVYSYTHGKQAVCIRYQDKSIEAWGNPKFGGKIPENMKPLLTNIEFIRNTDGAFAVISNVNKVFAWGHPHFGGKIPKDIQPLLQNVKEIATTKKAFAAVTYDGGVFAWGHPNYGGSPSKEIQAELYNVKIVYGNQGTSRNKFMAQFYDDRKRIFWP